MWVIYIPQRGPNTFVRSFIVGFLEMLRRWQWNFCKLLRYLLLVGAICIDITITDRLENEHLGNMDQYRVTREVPLPYAFNDSRRDDADDDDDLQVKR